jgi:hypothetical protein
VLTQAPLPTWLDLARALMRRPATGEALAKPWCRMGDCAGWLSRSAWSIALIASWRTSLAGGAAVKVWIPDFFCNSSLEPLRALGARLTFYPLTEKMAPDMSVCRALQKEESPDIFLLVHYFGEPTATDAAEFCSRAGAWLIEDAAHVLLPTRGIGEFGDFVLYSPHKHLPIPEGAVLVVRQNGPGHFGPDEIASFGSPGGWASQLRKLQQHLGSSEARSRVHALAWLAKRSLQKLGLGDWRQRTTPYREQAIPPDVVCSRLVAPMHGGLSRRLLTSLIARLGIIARYRQRHQLLWDALLVVGNGSDSTPVTTTDRPLGREWTPYLAAYHVDAENAESIYLEWQRKGLPVTTWPDLPPEVTANPSEHRRAWNLRHSRIYLPVHQSLNALDLTRRFRPLELGVEEAPRLNLVWDGADQIQWENWLARCGRSNLLQTWAYGAAKASTSRWRVKRVVIYCAGEPIALAQVLQLRIAGMFMISRINRGPIYLRSMHLAEQQAVWDELSCLGCFRIARALSVIPEEELTGPTLLLFAVKRFRQFSPLAWESAWIDLGLDLATLRKQLDAKWRNMLSFAERTDLQLEIGRDSNSFEWMLDRYREDMQDKRFRGPSIEFLRNLQRCLDGEPRLIVMRAIAAGAAVAGVCLAPHGAGSTYLLGWNGSAGRNLKANQYLLWQSIVYLKQKGFRWFDLGGIAEERNPGITAFKLGLNGRRYESIGEYWKW